MEDILVFVIRAVAIGFIGAPIATLLHELGHASAALLLTQGDVRVWLGPIDKEPTKRLGRLRLGYTRLSGFTGFYNYDGGYYDRAARAIIIIAGPTISLLLGLVAFILGTVGPIADTWLASNLIIVIGYPAVIQLVATAIPIRYPAGWGEYAGMPSDGLRLVRLFRDETRASVKP